MKLSRHFQRGTRAAARGVTLFEVLIVVAILAMVAGGVAVFALPNFQKAQVKTAETGARTIRTAVQTWQFQNDNSCPTVAQLVADKVIDSGTNTADPWGGEFTIACENDEVVVRSGGPDKKMGTADDIQIPKAAAAPTPEG